MIGFYIGISIFITGTFINVINRNAKVSMSGDFWDMPMKIKIGILLICFGILLSCGSVMFELITNPVDFLRQLNPANMN